MLSDLRKKIIDMQYLDLACLFSKLSIAENTKLVTNPTTNANILGDIKVMHRGLINKDSLDEFCGEKTWKKLGKNKGLHGIGMYILTDNLFQLLSWNQLTSQYSQLIQCYIRIPASLWM